MAARTFTFQQGTSSKFWTIEVSGTEHTVHYGRIGTAGQVKSKAFADPAKATAAADKLIAEKLSKGYIEQGTATPPPAAAPAPPAPASGGAASPPAAAATAPRAPASPPAAAAAPGAPAPLRSGVTLRPDEWAYATWRPLPDPPGEPPEFDRAQAAVRLRNARTDAYGWRWVWRDAPFTSALTPEEAGAWLRLTNDSRREPPAALAKEMANYDQGPLHARGAPQLAVTARLPGAFALAALVDVIGTEATVEWLLDPSSGIPPRHRSDEDEPRLGIARGVRAGLLPRLDKTDRERFTAAVADWLDRSPPAGTGKSVYPWMLATQLGLYDQLHSIIDTWGPDGPGAYYHSPEAMIFGLESADAVRAAWERVGHLHMYEPWPIVAWLAHTEASALDVVATQIAAGDNKEWADLQLRTLGSRVHDPAAGPVMLGLARNSKAQPAAREWLAAHPLEATVGLARVLPKREVLDHLRARKRAGDDLAAALPYLDDPAPFTELVLEHEEPNQREVTRDELPPPLAAALADLSRKRPAGLTVEVATLPPIAIGDGRLADADVDAVVQACSQLKPDDTEIPAVLSVLAEHTDTDPFAWALFETWLGEGGPSKARWAMLQLGPLGGDASATKLAPMIRAWPGESQHQRAVLGLGVLGAIGTDTALMQLSGIAEKVKFKALQQRAREAMDAIAAAKGMTKAELEDRIVPDCDLDADGRRSFEISGKTYEFVLGPGMKPMLRDPAGKLRASPPKPSDEWKLLRKQVTDVAKIQAARLEQAMVTQRRWSVDGFERFIVRHPLQRHLARLLVWRAGEQTFRVTDELDYADADDEPVTLNGEVGLVHPLQLAEDERAAWGELLADYEIVPPFPQLARPVLDVEPGELSSQALTRFKPVMVGASAFIRILENRGWQRGQAWDAGIFHLHAKPFASLDVTAVVQYDGVPMGAVVDWEDQSFESVYVVKGAMSAHDIDDWGPGRGARQLQWREVDPIVRSEVLADIAAVLEKAR